MLARWTAELDADRVGTTRVIRLEVLYSAQSAIAYEAIAEELDGLIQIACPQEALDRAEEVQHLLARAGALHHRSVSIPDLIVAAAAELSGATVWHYDEDYDRISKITGQPTEWVAPRGTLH